MTKIPEIVKHALVMLSGSVVAQLIPLISSPLLTRLYSPVEYGAFSSVLAMAGVISVVANLRYDLAIVLPEQKAQAANLAALSIATGIVVSTVLFLVVILSRFEIVSLEILRNIGLWSFAVPCLCLFVSIQQVLSFFGNRIAAYKAIASSSIVLQAVVAVVAILLGLFIADKGQVNGLIIARVLGVFVGIVALYIFLKKSWSEYRSFISLRGMRQVFFTYKQFPLINVPYSLLGIFSREFFVLALTSFNLLHVAGQYGLARMVLNAPINFMTAALSQVFYREAAKNSNSQAFRDMTSRILSLLALGVAPLLFWALYWAEDVFVMIFGHEWREAGSYAAMLMPVIVCSLFTSWPERIFEVRQRQKLALLIQLLFDSSSIFIILLMLNKNQPIRYILFAYVVVQLIYHATYLSAVVRLIGLNYRFLLSLSLFIFVGFIYTYFVHFLSAFVVGSQSVRIIIEFFIVLIVAIFFVNIFKKKQNLCGQNKGVVCW